MKQTTRIIRSGVAVLAGLSLTTALALCSEWAIIRNGIVTPEMIKTVWALDLLAAFAGGYVTARVAVHSHLKHAIAAAGIFALVVSTLDYLSGTSLLHLLISSLAVVVSICMGAVFRDWHRRNERRIEPHAV